MKKHEMEKKIESALNSLDHVCRQGPGPFFYTRLQARLHRKDRTFWEKTSGFIARPAVAFSVICLIISINTLVIFQRESDTSITEQQNNFLTPDDSDIDTIAFYDEENNNSDTQ